MKKYNFKIKDLLFLALPLIFSNLINATSGLISMYFLSQINTNALAAGAIITSTYGLIVMVVISMLYSVSIMVGKMQGSDQHNEIGSIVFAGIMIATVIGIPLTAIMFYMDAVFELLGQSHAISVLACKYFEGTAIGFIPSLIGAVYMQLFMGISRTKIILYITFFGIFINSALSYACIFGYGSIPPMGMFGAGLANSITAYILLIMTVAFTMLSPIFNKYQLFNYEALKLKYIPILLKIGTPISIQYSAEILGFSVLTYLMGIIGIDALGAQQIALQCSMIGIMIIMAISQSGSILVSQAFGQSDITSINKIANSAFLLGTLFMLVIGMVYWFFPMTLIALYLDVNNPALNNTIYLTKTILSIAAFTQLFDGGRNVAAGLLRGSGDTKSSMWTGIVSCWFIGIPAAIVFGFLLHFGAPGIRFGMLLGILLGCINLVYRFYAMNRSEPSELAYAK